MKYLLTYYVGSRAIQSWHFHSKALAYWMKNELLYTNNYQLGTFKITKI